MRRWMPFYIDALTVFYLVVASTLCTPIALGTETSGDPKPSKSVSTLNAQIAPQDFELSYSVFEMVGMKATPYSPRLKSVPLAAPQTKASPAPKTQASSAKRAPHSKTITSPFKKWVSPQATVSDQDAKQDEALSAEAPEIEEPEVEDSEDEDPTTAPQVVQRSPTPESENRVKNIPRMDQVTTSRIPAAPSPLIRSKKSLSKKRPSVQAKTLPVKVLPTPVAELTAKPNQVALEDLEPLTQRQQRLRIKIRRVLNDYHQRPLNTQGRGPWEIMHALLAYEVNSKILSGGPKGDPVSAVGWLCFNQACKKRTLMHLNEDGEIRVRVGPALQGHQGQLLAMLAQAKVSKDYPIRIEGVDFTVADLVKMEMRTCYPRTELTFKLIGLMHYLDSDATWVNDQGMAWNIPKLISEEMRQPVRSAACGGTHRLSGLTLAFKTREQRGEPVDGEYLKAHKFSKRYQQTAYRLQNRDGSLSTSWFRGKGNEQDLDRKLKTTGHQLEWLLYAASEKELKHWKTANAANYLATIMFNNRYRKWEAGPLGHAIHALLLYDRMVFSDYDALENHPMAQKPKPSTVTHSKRK